jgi:hypothetical protein
MTLRPARDGDAAVAVDLEDRQSLPRLRPAEQLLEPGDIFEALFEGLRAFLGIRQLCFAVEPRALLLWTEKLAQTFGAAGEGHWSSRLSASRHRTAAVRQQPIRTTASPAVAVGAGDRKPC